MASERDHRHRRLFAAGAAAAALLVLGLQVVAIDRQSLIGDAPYHLLAGDQALRYGRNQLNLEHPPLVKLLAAWPLLDEEPLAPPVAMDRAIVTSLRLFEDPARTRRAQLEARTVLLIVFALPFLAAGYFLGRRWGGARTGGVLALALGLSLSVLPFLAVIQTDSAVALGFVATLLASLRYLERATLAGAVAIGAGLGLAVAAKYSGLLLSPTVLLAVVLAGRGSGEGRTLRLVMRRSGHLAVIASVAAALVDVTYAAANRSYDPEIGRDTLERYLHGEGMITDDSMERHEALVLAAERLDPNLAQWLTGLLGIRAQNAAGVYPSYAFGHLSSRGRWWYFPALLLLQTPLALLIATGCGVAANLRAGGAGRAAVKTAGRRGQASLLLAVTAAVYLGVAMSSSYNLGVRHLLPILPVLYLPAARWAAQRRRRSALLVAVLAVEAVVLAPLWMSSTNTSWMGRFNPVRAAFGSLEYHQNFRVLAGEARARGIGELHVLYPLLHPAELAAYLPEARLLTPESEPRPGGWYAVSVLVEQYLPAVEHASAANLRGHRNLVALARAWTPLWRAIERGEDHGWVAGTFHLYRLPDAGAGISKADLAVVP